MPTIWKKSDVKMRGPLEEGLPQFRRGIGAPKPMEAEWTKDEGAEDPPWIPKDT